MYACPHDVESYKRSADAKIGGIAAISDTRFLLVEQAADKDGNMRNLIYAVDISGASDISGLKAKNGMELETVRDMKDLNGLGVKPASKELLVDLRKFGWTAEKAEGIALLDDGRTLAICSDNDFGIGLNFKNPSADENGKKVSKITKYTLRDGALFLDGKKSDAAIEIVPTGETQAFWLIKMPEKIR